MRILRVIATAAAEAGGPIEGVRQSSRFHARWGHTTTVVTCDVPGTEVGAEDSFEILPLGPGSYGWAYSKELRSWLKAHLCEFDLAFMHGLWLYPSHALFSVREELLAEGCEPPPTYFFSHGMLDPWFQSWSRRPVKTLRNVLYWKLIEQRAVARASAMLFTSEEERRLARVPFRPYKPKDEIVVPYGTAIPPERSDNQARAFRASCPEIKGQPYLLFLSRLHPKKGIDLLLDAYLEQRARNPNLPDLVIAGPQQDAAFCSSLRKQASAAGGHIHFPGMISGDAKWGAYHGCEAFILPSHQENFGIVVAEALACGKSALITDKVNIWQEVRDAGAGMVEPDTADGVAKLLDRWFATTEQERAQGAVAARELFLARFNAEAAAQALIDLATPVSSS